MKIMRLRIPSLSLKSTDVRPVSSVEQGTSLDAGRGGNQLHHNRIFGIDCWRDAGAAGKGCDQ